MGGKASILLVLGFSLIFLIIGHNFGNVSTRATDNFADYFDSTMAYNIAISGTNIVANKFFVNSGMTDGSGSIDFQGGEIEYSFVTSGVFSNIKEITVTGSYNDISKTVKVSLQPSKFSRFAYFSVYEGNIWWKTSDTVWGPMHAQGALRVAGEPVFMGKTTSRDGIIKYDNNADPQFYGGYESGVDLPLPPEGIDYLDSIAAVGGKKISGHDTVYLTFQNDSINVKYGKNKSDTTYLGSAFAPNGVIMANGATVRMKGSVGGQFTVSTKSAYQPALWENQQVWSNKCWCYKTKKVKIQDEGYTGGNVYLDDDLVYENNPLTNPNSTDLMGIVSEGDIMISDNAANNSNIKIHASIFSQTGGFGAENYDTRPIAGKIELLGGIIQDTRRAVGTFSGVTTNHGFDKRYRYDERFLLVSPPHFPGTGSYEIISWFE